MPVGVPETEVFAAADRVLARGERPTVERVRLELGRGSPARVGQLLETWWDALAKRIAGETRLPTLPAEVAQAFTAVWSAACAQAQQTAADALAQERAELEADRTAAAQAQAVAERAATASQEEAAAARHAQLTAETRLADLLPLIEAQRERADRAESQVAALVTTLARREAELLIVREALEATRTAAVTERAQLTAHIQSVENRAHGEVDRAREELKAIKRELATAQRELHAAAKAVQTAALAQHAAEKRAAASEARAEALVLRTGATGRRPPPSSLKTRKRPAAKGTGRRVGGRE